MVKASKDVPKRLQNVRMRLQNYDLTVVYRPGIEQYITDAISRSLLTQQQESKNVVKVNTVSHILIGEQWRESIIRESNNYKVMSDQKETIMKGWPEEKVNIPDTIRPYHQCRDELAVHDDLIYRGERVVIPAALKSAMKKLLHSSHLGIQACLRRGRECIFWPQMNSEITKYISRCEICQ